MINKRIRQQGFGIIDILIGLLIGFIIVFTTYSSLLFFQSHQRTGVNGNTALGNGILGLYALENDLKSAGLGFYFNGSPQCSVFNASYDGKTIATNALAAPVKIQDGQQFADSITLLSGTSILSGVPARPLSALSISSGSTIAVNTLGDLQIGNLALIGNASTVPCTIVKLTNVTDNTSNGEITYDSGSSASITYPSNSFINNIGHLNWSTWRINNNNLELLDLTTGNTMTVADNIVQLQAQYGISSNSTTKNIQQWVDATGIWASLNTARISQIRAVRVAIVARSPQREKSSIPGSSCDTTTQAPMPWPNGTAIDLSTNPDWRCYRYRIFKTVVPIKNVVIGN